MILTLHNTYNLLVLGGTSAIGISYVRRKLSSLNEQGSNLHVILAGRSVVKLDAEAADIRARGATVEVVEIEFTEMTFERLLDKIPGKFDEAILAYGSLTVQEKSQSDFSYLSNELITNFVSACVCLEKIAQIFENQGHGSAIILGSVAGDRGRQSNYTYGSAKAGIETFVSGLQHRFASKKHIHFMLVKPGFVDTPMTAHIQSKGVLWAKPEQVARVMEKALSRKRLTVYAPWFWRWIMLIVRNVPSLLFHRTKL